MKTTLLLTIAGYPAAMLIGTYAGELIFSFL